MPARVRWSRPRRRPRCLCKSLCMPNRPTRTMRSKRRRPRDTASPSSGSSSRFRRPRTGSKSSSSAWSKHSTVPLAIVLNGARSTAKPDVPLNILVPTGGTPDARLATEIALALAKASDGTLTALHVFDPQDDTELLRGRARRQGLSVLVDARRLGKRSGVLRQGHHRDPFEARGRDPPRRASGPLRSRRGWHLAATRRDEVPRSAQLGPASLPAISSIADCSVMSPMAFTPAGKGHTQAAATRER